MQSCTRFTLLWLCRPFRSPAQVSRLTMSPVAWVRGSRLLAKQPRQMQNAWALLQSMVLQLAAAWFKDLPETVQADAFAGLRLDPEEQSWLELLQAEEQLGRGAQGSVWRCTLNSVGGAAAQGHTFALKVSQSRHRSAAT